MPSRLARSGLPLRVLWGYLMMVQKLLRTGHAAREEGPVEIVRSAYSREPVAHYLTALKAGLLDAEAGV